MITRALHIDKLLKPKKELILYGARRVGEDNASQGIPFPDEAEVSDRFRG
jgi:hypothetical protein